MLSPMKLIIGSSALALLYLVLTHFTVGLMPVHFVVIAIILGLTWAHPKTRLLVISLLPFALFSIIFDYLRLIPQESAGTIQVFAPYFLEFLLFSFPLDNVWILPNDFFRQYYHEAFDIYFGIIYFAHIFVPIGVMVYLWAKSNPHRYRFGWAFFIANMLAFITYVAYPAAAPWYVELYGMTPGDFSITGSAAGLLRVDQLIGIPYFDKIYSSGAWVFGALPSMHAGVPALTLLYTLKLKMKRTSTVLAIHLVSVWTAAVYLRHHYIIDLLLGALYCAITYWVIESGYEKRRSIPA
jgi:inositol phosphorylceramide synthase catalytic subunit